MYSDDFQPDPLADQDDDATRGGANLDLEEGDLEDEEDAYLIHDDEMGEEFQFQN